MGSSRRNTGSSQRKDSQSKEPDDIESIGSSMGSDFPDWWPEDPTFESVGKQIEEAILKFKRLKDPKNYKLIIQLCADEHATAILQCRFIRNPEYGPRASALFIQDDYSERNNQPNFPCSCSYCPYRLEYRQQPIGSRMRFPVPVCYGACKCFHRQCLDNALKEMHKKWAIAAEQANKNRATGSLYAQLRQVFDQLLAIVHRG